MGDARKYGRKTRRRHRRGKHYGYSRVRTLADAIDAFEKRGNDITTADDRSR